jgi:predicted nucleic acid-binding protein
MAVYYLDTSILLDCYEKRGRNGEAALRLVMKIINTNSVVLYSDLHIQELRRLGYSAGEVNEIFSILKPHCLRRIHTSSFQKDEARKIAVHCGVPRGDALHAILARDNDALVVSRDPHFSRLRGIVEKRLPEET